MIDLVNVTKTYETGTHALNGIDMHIDDGEFVFLVGPSGSGKSTIIKLLTAELKPTSGSVLVNGYQLESIKRASISYMRRTLGVIFQDFRLIENKTVYENVAFAMRVIGARPAEIRQRVPFVLRLVGLMTKASCYPEELSGGEQQRVALARALTNNANLIIADEPTGNIDPTMSYEVVKLLTCLNEMGTTIVMVTHEHELVRAFDRRVITLGNGCIVGDTAAQAPQEPDVPQPIEPLSDAVQAGGAL